MNIYANIINRYFDYKGQTWQVISHLYGMGGYPVSENEECFRECRNVKTNEVVKFGYEDCWNFIPRGYSINAT